VTDYSLLLRQRLIKPAEGRRRLGPQVVVLLGALPRWRWAHALGIADPVMRPVYGQRVNELCRVLEVPASVGICACRADTGLDRIVAGNYVVSAKRRLVALR